MVNFFYFSALMANSAAFCNNAPNLHKSQNPRNPRKSDSKKYYTFTTRAEWQSIAHYSKRSHANFKFLSPAKTWCRDLCPTLLGQQIITPELSAIGSTESSNTRWKNSKVRFHRATPIVSNGRTTC